MPSTMPTRPIVTSVTSFWNPTRASATAAETPRSSSITVTRERAQPSATARSASAYCSRVDSPCSSTCCRLDWRTYTIAARSRCSGPTLSSRRAHGRDTNTITTAAARRGHRPGRPSAQHSDHRRPPVGRQHQPDRALGGSSGPGIAPHPLPGAPGSPAYRSSRPAAATPRPRVSGRGSAQRQRPGSLQGHHAWPTEESFQGGKGLAGLDEHQVRRWLPWRRWTLLAMLAHALLVVLAAGEHAAGPPPTGLIPLTCNELQRLLLRRVIEPARRPADPETWSRWRRRHQYRARISHYRRQAADLS